MLKNITFNTGDLVIRRAGDEQNRLNTFLDEPERRLS